MFFYKVLSQNIIQGNFLLLFLLFTRKFSMEKKTILKFLKKKTKEKKGVQQN